MYIHLISKIRLIIIEKLKDISLGGNNNIGIARIVIVEAIKELVILDIFVFKIGYKIETKIQRKNSK